MSWCAEAQGPDADCRLRRDHVEIAEQRGRHTLAACSRFLRAYCDSRRPYHSHVRLWRHAAPHVRSPYPCRCSEIFLASTWRMVRDPLDASELQAAPMVACPNSFECGIDISPTSDDPRGSCHSGLECGITLVVSVAAARRIHNERLGHHHDASPSFFDPRRIAPRRGLTHREVTSRRPVSR